METRRNPLSGLEPGEAIRAHDSLDPLSDEELFRAAAEIIARPKQEFSSFRMHAPLELLARFGLLPLVTPEDRRQARIHVLATTAHYESAGATIGDVGERDIGADSAPALMSRLREAIREGDVERSDGLFMALAGRFGAIDVVGSVAEPALHSLRGFGHTHIGLMLLTRLWAEAGPEVRKLPRAGVRALAEDPDLTLEPTTGPGRLEELEEALATVPTVEPTEPGGLHSLVQAAEEAGLVDEILGDALSRKAPPAGWEEVARTACRIAALSMVADAREETSLDEFLGDPLGTQKYGWAHCITIPQAAWALGRIYSDPSSRRQAAQTAATWVIALRAAYGDGDLDTDPEIRPVEMDITEALYDSPEAAASTAWHAEPEERPRLVRVLATEAALRIDAHLVKNTRACLDAARMHPEQAHLYHAAAAYLCSIWCREEPRDLSAERLAVPREH